MKNEKLNKPLTVHFSDGTVKAISYTKVQFLPDDRLILEGILVDPVEDGATAEQEAEIEAQSEIEAVRPAIRNYMFKSALLRFLYEGRLTTAAITHATDKAWRVINMSLGVAWIPKNVIRWSDIAQQFCIVDETYVPDFTLNTNKGMDEYPSIFDPDEIIYHEYD